MTFNEYIPLAQRTDSNEGKDKMTNAMLGMVGELGECLSAWVKLTEDPNGDRAEKLNDELGDFCWYMAAAAAYLGEDVCRFGEEEVPLLTVLFSEDLMPKMMRLNICIAELTDMWKKHMFQGHRDFDREKAGILLEKIYKAFYVFAMQASSLFDFSELFELNIEKLKKRYPNGFEASRSLNRK